MSKRRTPEEEAAAAAYYESRIDSWEESSDPVPASPGEQPREVGSIVTVRFSADEAAVLREAAEREGRTNSDIIRRAVSAYVKPMPMSSQVNHTWSARPIGVHVYIGQIAHIQVTDTMRSHLSSPRKVVVM
ncbi:MAG: ribbon-helix-helix domain-containing protein [Dehalococcoidia bacterium]